MLSATTAGRPEAWIKASPLSIAERYIGVHERAGDRHHPLIQWWLELAGLPEGSGDEVPWCGAAVNFAAWQLDLPRPKMPARARSWLTVGEYITLSRAVPGFDVVILKRGQGEQPGPEQLAAPGHVGLFVELRGDFVNILGGNQGDAVSVGSWPTSQILGIRRL